MSGQALEPPPASLDEARPYKDLTGDVKKIEKDPFQYGGFSDIFRGVWFDKVSGKKYRVAIKVLRGLHTDKKVLEATTKRLNRETKVWHLLNHPNVLPFYGVAYGLGAAKSPALISPLCDYGNIVEYLTTRPDIPTLGFVIDVAKGLEYLHSKEVVHGDLTGHNVLIKDGVPCICDFGRSKVIGHRGYTTVLAGAVPFMAPELFGPLPSIEINGDGPVDETYGAEIDLFVPNLTKKTDTYAFSMVALEIVARKAPYYYLPKQPTYIAINVSLGMRPKREKYSVVSDQLWPILMRSWLQDPAKRPEISEVVQSLKKAQSQSAKDS